MSCLKIATTYSPALTVPSAQVVLTSLFEMVRGETTAIITIKFICCVIVLYYVSYTGD